MSGVALRSRRTRSRCGPLLLDSFSPDLPPTDRAISKLDAVLDGFARVLKKIESVAWAESEEVPEGDDADVTNLRANTVAALYNQLHWILKVFRHVPGASVTIR